MSFIVAGIIVHFHIDHFVLIVVAVAAIIGITDTIAFLIALLLHALVFRAPILEPYFHLRIKNKQTTKNVSLVKHVSDRN